MRGMFEFKTAWGILCVVFFYAFTVLVIPYTSRGLALRGLLLILSWWGLLAYWRPFWRAISHRGWPDGGMLYGVMVFAVCASYNVNIAIALIWRSSGQPAYLVNNALFDFWIVLGILAMTLAVTVPDLFGKDVPPKDKVRLGSAWALAFFLVTFLIIIQPDLKPIAELLRPMLDSNHEYLDPE